MFKLLVQAAVLVGVAQGPVFAQDRQADVRVYHGDLDLTQSADVHTLDRRLSYAVDAACPSGNGVRDMAQRRAIALCHRTKRAEIAPLRQSALAAAQLSRATFAATR
jgi:UrcA family protein